MNLKIAIQGIKGCFHDAAAHEYFVAKMPEATIGILPCNTFAELFELLDSTSALGIVAIENTIAGPLLQNHELLRKSQLTIIGEHKTRISHIMCALPGQAIEDIREVHSHPMVLMQCEQFLRRYPKVRLVEGFDTAGSARRIAEEIIESLGCTFDPRQRGLFLWSKIPEWMKSGEWLSESLLQEADVFLTPGFRFMRTKRISIRHWNESKSTT